MRGIYEKPTVKQVIFQIIFPNLLYMDSKIGNFQFDIMEKFPESAELISRPLVFAETGPDSILDKLPLPDLQGKKIWQFKDPERYTLNVTNNSLDITSEYYKAYDNEDSEDKFRDIIQFVLDNFLKQVRIPIIKRVGLRYIDDCPLPKKITNKNFKTYYNTAFPLSRFNAEHLTTMQLVTIVKKDQCFMRYAETLNYEDDKPKYILDFDGYAENIRPVDCLSVTDILHTIISEEYESTIKDPVRKIMRNEG